MGLAIVEARTGAVLAEGEDGSTALKYEGNWYFAPSAVDASALIVTDRTYTCPYKGTCRWVDYRGPDGTTLRDVAWVYPTTKAGHEAIAGRYGFYAGARGSTREETRPGS